MSAACLPFQPPWTSQCPGRESNSHARLERRLLRPVCLPVVPPPGRECVCSGRGSNSHGPRSPLASRASVSTGRFHHPSLSCGSRIRTDGLRGMSPAICHLIYPAMNLYKDNTAFPEGLEPPPSWSATRRSLPLSYGNMWNRSASNRQPPGCRPGALPIELRPHVRKQGVEPCPSVCRTDARPLELLAHVPTPGIEPGCSALQADAWTTTARSANNTAVRTGIEPVSLP